MGTGHLFVDTEQKLNKAKHKHLSCTFEGFASCGGFKLWYRVILFAFSLTESLTSQDLQSSNTLRSILIFCVTTIQFTVLRHRICYLCHCPCHHFCCAFDSSYFPQQPCQPREEKYRQSRFKQCLWIAQLSCHGDICYRIVIELNPQGSISHDNIARSQVSPMHLGEQGREPAQPFYCL